MRTSEQIITRLKELKEDNSISSYTHIKNILKNQLIPIIHLGILMVFKNQFVSF